MRKGGGGRRCDRTFCSWGFGGAVTPPPHSLLCGPISPVVNLEMSSTARFFVEMQYIGAQD